MTLLLGLSSASVAQNKNDIYVFEDVKRLPVTSMKSQDRAGTCWSWSALSFFESEVIRLGKDSVSLAPLYVVWNTYNGKADKFVRMHGHSNFSQGGAFTDVTWAIRNFGIVPLEVYKGLNYGETVHVHGEVDAILKGYVDAVVKNPNKKLSTAWKRGYEAVLNAYFGEKPESFTWKGKEYTPQTFASEACGLNMDDYVSITSYTHHPFYSKFAVEVPDNWLWGLSYNLPMEEMMEVMDNAIDNGYSIAWASDISEAGFSRDGYAIVPEENVVEMSDAEISKWLDMPKEEQKAAKKPGQEKTITQEMRQIAFDNYQSTDDHGMQIMGKAKDKLGNDYFIVKNSWGEYNKYKGYFYASYPFVAYKTTSLIVHKDAIPKTIKKKMGIK